MSCYLVWSGGGRGCGPTPGHLLPSHHQTHQTVRVTVTVTVTVRYGNDNDNGMFSSSIADPKILKMTKLWWENRQSSLILSSHDSIYPHPKYNAPMIRCYAGSILELWEYNGTRIHNLTRQHHQQLYLAITPELSFGSGHFIRIWIGSEQHKTPYITTVATDFSISQYLVWNISNTINFEN